MSRVTITQCLTAIKELAFKEQQRHEETLQKIATLEMNITQYQSEMSSIKNLVEDSKQEVASLKSSYTFFETSFEEFKTTILENESAV